MTPEALRQQLEYNPETGSLTRRHGRGGQPAGSEVGYLHPSGYRRATFYGKYVAVHHIIWAWMTGHWPDFPAQEVDHINGDRSDNRWSNLRLVNRSVNQRNCKRREDNVSGLTGVHLVTRHGLVRWQAQICNRHLGVYDNLLDAAAARKSAELQHNFTKQHGR